MGLLRSLTLIYTGVLVSAVAASLGGIWFYLRRIANTLGEVREALAPAPDLTAPLDEHLQRLHDATAGVAEDLAATRASIERADARLATVVQRFGAGRRP